MISKIEITEMLPIFLIFNTFKYILNYFVLLALNFSISNWTSFMQSWWNCFLYPRKKRTSRMTKSGAVMKAWSQESSSAGARPSNTPCPIN